MQSRLVNLINEDIDIQFDLGCGTSNSDAQANSNTSRINAFFTEWAAGGTSGWRRGRLIIPTRWFPINDTLGRDYGTGISGLPQNVEVRGVGHHFGFGGLTNNETVSAGGLYWRGDSDRPMVRLGRFGNKIKINLMGYAWSSGSTPPGTRAESGIELTRPSGGTPTSKATISGCIAGCTSAIRTTFQTQELHADEVYFPDLFVRDCVNAFWANNVQGISYAFGRLQIQLPSEQSYIFKFDRGGKLSCQHLSVVGNYGTTILKTSASGGASGNSGSFVVNYFTIDALQNYTSQDGFGYFRIVEQDGDTYCYVRMRGHMPHDGKNLGTIWYNFDGTSAVSTTGNKADFELDVWGLDRATALLFCPKRIRETKAVGTAYSLTTTSAALSFGTTNPVVVLNGFGSWRIGGRVRLKFSGATFNADRTVTLKLRRTNNTTVDLSSAVLSTGTMTTVTQTWVDVVLPEVVHSTENSNDSITIFGDVATLPTAGTLDCVAAQIIAEKVA